MASPSCRSTATTASSPTARGLAAFRSLPSFAHGLLLGWAKIPGGRSTSGSGLLILGSGALDGGVPGALILALDEERQP